MQNLNSGSGTSRRGRGALRGAPAMTGRVAAWLALTVLLDLTRRIGSDRLTAMGNPSVYAWQDEFSAAEFQTAPDAAKQDADRVRAEFVASLPAGSPAYLHIHLVA